MNGLTNITALNIAAGDARRTVRMKYAPLNPGETQVSTDGNVEIKMCPLDECMAELGVTAIDYLKIDVEGYELFVSRSERKQTSEKEGDIAFPSEHSATAASGG
jgi:FkbM family methyltransferase